MFNSPKPTSPWVLSALAALALTAMPFAAQAQGYTLKTLGTFNLTNGAQPYGSLTPSADGTLLYGTAYEGGAGGDGTVFSIPVGGGAITTLATFNGTNGSLPLAGLTLSGNTLYGTTSSGGVNNNDSGTVFSLPVGGGTPTTLTTFSSAGTKPRSNLLLNGGMLYGTTTGGNEGNGTIFSLPVGGGTATTIATFYTSSSGSPLAGLTLVGNTLYGTGQAGGADGYGTVYSVPVTGGTPTTLANFYGTNGGFPQCVLVPSADGSTLYGTTQSGGANGYGTVFSVPITGGPTTTLVSFNGTNGRNPVAGLILVGNTLYGTTDYGGVNSGGGIVFSLPITGGTPTTLASFNSTNGSFPIGGLTMIGGTFYGTTANGGANGYGTVFSLTPNAAPEPSPWAPMGLGALGLTALAIRKRREYP